MNLLYFSVIKLKTKKKILIEFNDKVEKTEFILVKTFLDDTKFTVNNEETAIYFYTKRAEYFNGNITELKDDDKSLNLSYSARTNAGICLGIIIFINLAIFAVYYFLKRKRMNNNIEYSKIE